MGSREGRREGMRGSRIIDLARGILSDYILDSYASFYLQFCWLDRERVSNK